MPKSRACLLFMVMLAALVAVARPNTAPAKAGATQKQEIKLLKKHIHKSATTVAFWKSREKGRWALHLRHANCADVYGEKRRKVCRMARHSLAAHTSRLKRATARLKQLTAPRDTGYLPPDQARELGRRMAAEVGWTGEQWRCLDRLWGAHESSWRVTADNPGSEAYGIPQALPGHKMGPGWQTSAYTQIRWGLRYIRNDGDFSTPCEALAFRIANGWY